jgi:hypothetical protein
MIFTSQSPFIVYLFNQQLQDLVVNVEGSYLSESPRTGAAVNRC